MQTKRTKLWLVLAGLVTLLSACGGYQLRQQAVLHESLHNLVWQTEVDADAFYPVLQRELANYQTRLSKEPADVLVKLHSLETSSSLLGKVRSYRATAIWSVTNVWGETIVYRHISTAMASESNVDSERELDQLKVQMLQNLAEQFVDQLSRISADQLTQKPSEPLS